MNVSKVFFVEQVRKQDYWDHRPRVFVYGLQSAICRKRTCMLEVLPFTLTCSDLVMFHYHLFFSGN